MRYFSASTDSNNVDTYLFRTDDNGVVQYISNNGRMLVLPVPVFAVKNGKFYGSLYLSGNLIIVELMGADIKTAEEWLNQGVGQIVGRSIWSRENGSANLSILT